MHADLRVAPRADVLVGLELGEPQRDPAQAELAGKTKRTFLEIVLDIVVSTHSPRQQAMMEPRPWLPSTRVFTSCPHLKQMIYQGNCTLLIFYQKHFPQKNRTNLS